jgi:hypothetical protein
VATTELISFALAVIAAFRFVTSVDICPSVYSFVVVSTSETLASISSVLVSNVAFVTYVVLTVARSSATAFAASQALSHPGVVYSVLEGLV